MSGSVFELVEFPEELGPGLGAVAGAFPGRFSMGGLALRLEPSGDKGFRITRNPDGLRVAYGRRIDAFRALGVALGDDGPGLSGQPPTSFAQSPRFDSLGLMLDASRNGVYTAGTLRALLVRAALMGLDACMLYMEDVYEVPGESFFGYLRGRYSAEELRSLDDFAYALGIELFPCIQSLGHLEQILQWPAYGEYRDDESIILAEDPKTYELLERMIAAASGPFRSRRINLGMDEANGIGQGAYRRRFGDRRPFDIMNDHLAKVRDICVRLGLKPLIWSDMFFRLGSATKGYYDPAWSLPEGVADRIPKDLRLVYWDYYHADYGFYVDWIGRHREMGTEPFVALGSWSWNRFWSELGFASRTIAPGMRACRDEGIREVVLTNWGDDGMEVDIWSALPAWQLFAEYGWASEARAADEASIEAAAAARFRGSTGGDYAAWVDAAGLDRLPGAEEKHANPSKVLLWADVLLGLWEEQYHTAELPRHYAGLASRMDVAASRGGADSRLAFPAQIARVLALKTSLRPRLEKAYREGNKAALASVARVEAPALLRELETLWRMHRALWLEEYKPFGLEVLEMRYGFSRIRLESLSERLEDYLAGRASSIPELETELGAVFPLPPEKAPEVSGFRRIASPSRIV
jgi:hexosaminidase